MSVIGNQIVHVVKTCRFATEINGGIDCSGGKYALGLRAVGDGDNLVMSREDDFMFADNASAAHGMNADLAALALSADAVAVVFVAGIKGQFLADGFGNH